MEAQRNKYPPISQLSNICGLFTFNHKPNSRFVINSTLSSVKSLSRVQLFATPWTVAHEASPSMGFSRQEY